MTKTLLAALAFLPFAATSAQAGANIAPEAPVTYRVVQTARLDQIEGAKQVRWWISIPEEGRHQDVPDFTVVSAPGEWRVATDEDRANRFLYVEVDNPSGDAVEAVVEFTLRREPVWMDVDSKKVGAITDAHRRLFASELRKDAPHMEVTDEIATIADKVCGSEANAALQARMLLDHVADNADHYSKDPTKPSCGIGDAEDCLTNGGGCCTDLHSLFIALARHRGVPARLQMGYRLLEKNVGKEVDPGYRCWVEFFAPGFGWVPADIVEADATDGLGRDRWFAGLTSRRLWLNQGRDFVFDGAQADAPVNHMSLGYAEVDGVPARILPEGEKAPQLTRRVRFTEVGEGEPTTVSSL
jgi:transglutaminase-like putative cysteine protease